MKIVLDDGEAFFGYVSGWNAAMDTEDGVDSLTDGKIYEAIDEGDFYRVIDDSGEDYLYSKVYPAPLDGSSKGGIWVIVEE